MYTHPLMMHRNASNIQELAPLARAMVGAPRRWKWATRIKTTTQPTNRAHGKHVTSGAFKHPPRSTDWLVA